MQNQPDSKVRAGDHIPKVELRGPPGRGSVSTELGSVEE